MSPAERRKALAAQRALVQARSKVKRKPQQPLAIVESYTAALRGASREMASAVKRFVAPFLAATREEQRADAQIDLDFARLIRELERIAEAQAKKHVDAYAKRIAAWSLDDLSAVLGVDLEAEPAAVARLLDAWRARNVRLITSIARRLHADVRDVVRTSTREGTRVEVIAARLAERYSVSDSRARLIARDQILKANSDLTQARHASAGITRYRWSTAHDERVRGNPGGKWPKGLHYALDGQIFAWSDPPVANPNGERSHPGRDFQCRCVAIPVFDD